MIIKQIDIFSLKENIKLKSYKLNENGVSIILGTKEDKLGDGNGVGKTTFIECISMTLGASISERMEKSQKLIDEDIFIVMKIEVNKKNKYLGRRIRNSKLGYILDSDIISLDLNEWEVFEDKDYKSEVEKLNYINIENKDFPSFASVREYLIRDEKVGLNKIMLPNRNAKTSSTILAFLSLFPSDSEKNINKVKVCLGELKQREKLVNVISKDIKNIKAEKKELEKEINTMKSIVDNIDINKKIGIDREEYKTLKLELNDIQSNIFKLEKVKDQYLKNIDNLKEKIAEIEKLEDINTFYHDLIEYFPNELKKNYVEIKEFYDFMLVNRGKYFNKQIDEISIKLDIFIKQRNLLEGKIRSISEVLNQGDIVEDINSIIEDINEKNTRFAELLLKIEYYDQKKEVKKEMNHEKSLILKKTVEEEIIFEYYVQNKTDLTELFEEIVGITYNESGFLDFTMEQDISKSTTGRINIECKIDDDDSHGRSNMKVNMFDLTLLLNRIKKLEGINYLIHDGAYCTPNDNSSKYGLISFIESELKEIGRGQYIITANLDEFDEEDMTKFYESNLVIAKFDRCDNDVNRFFGFKY